MDVRLKPTTPWRVMWTVVPPNGNVIQFGIAVYVTRSGTVNQLGYRVVNITVFLMLGRNKVMT